MLADCRTDVEKNQYKRSGQMKEEFDAWNRQYHPDFYRVHRIGSYNDVFEQICERMEIPETGERFLYFIDPRYLFDTTRGYRFENLTPDYARILSHGLEELKYPPEELTNTFCSDYNRTIDSLENLVRRIIGKEENGRRKQYFVNMLTEKARGFEEALQRVLFVNQMFWQMGHRLIGLGHLDSMLWEYYQQEREAGILSREEACAILLDFLQTLHEYYWLKSNVLMGDTGQIIILGTRDMDGTYQSNELTELFLEAVMKLQLPDPKLLLRVGKDIPQELMELALRCMQTGVGSPILSNDDIIIPKLIRFGVKKEDAFAYGTSACWEPLVPGKSMSPNNITYLAYPKLLQQIWETEPWSRFTCFEDYMDAFYRQLHMEIQSMEARISEFRLQYNPLLSVFTDCCYEKKLDVSAGGAAYSNFGITTVGLSNTVNALLNIKKYVYDEGRLSLCEVKEILEKDFAGREELRNALKGEERRYGVDDEEVISMSNAILKHTTVEMEDYRNYLGGRLKLGVSAPSYIDAAKDFPATFDGRKSGEAFGVHISSDKSDGYTEIVNFAAALDYGENRFNGNVVDFMVSPHFIEQNFKKFVLFLKLAVSVGFFQLQMNVISSEQLIAAKKDPGQYPNLIVRVWGFSAYFAELPEAYQDVLIRRALESEGKGLASE